MDYEAAFTTDEVKDFLQQCAYVAKTLQERHPEFWNQSMMLEPIEGQMRPRTQPLLEREEDLKHDYGAKNLAMRGS